MSKSWMWSVAAWTLVGGCAGEVQIDEDLEELEAREAAERGEEVDIDGRTDGLHLWSGATKWPGGQVPVCSTAASRGRATFDAEWRTVRNRAFTTWGAVSRVDFQGWGHCPATLGNTIAVTIDGSGSGSSGGFGVGTLNMLLGAGRSDFGGSLTPHEFGHALGFTHEMARADFPDVPGSSCVEDNFPGDTLNTPPDQSSIMASTGYCQNNPNISLWDVVGIQTAYGRRLNGVAPLVNAWHAGRGDHIATASDAGIQSARDAGYRFAYADGWILTVPAPGTVPLKLWWHAGRADNIVTATEATERAAREAGYVFVRNEGYVYPTSQPGTVPLRLFWSGARGDNFHTTTPEGAAAALAAGYSEIRVEGYVFSSRPYDILWLYWHGGRGDNLTTAEASPLASAADDAAYGFVAFDGAVLKYALPGTVPLKTFWSGARADHFLTATAAGERDALAAGYVYLRTEGYVFPSAVSGMVPLKSWWSSARGDNFSTAHRDASAIGAGYGFVRNEGYVFGLN